jgi:SAM-dependent methyltransferase
MTVNGPNAAQIADWNGAVGQRWAAEQAKLDELIRPFGEAVLAAAKASPGDRVLDIGCGCGETSIALAKAVGPDGQVLGVDVSSPMLEIARQRSAGLANVSFLEADASQAKLPGGYSLLASRFGVMFFDAPAAAFRHIGSALAPGTRLAFVCWQPAALNPWATVAARAALQAAGMSPPQTDPRAPGPFAFADTGYVTDILAQAGFSDIAARPVEADMHLGDTPADAAVSALKVGPASRIAREAGPEAFPKLLRAVEDALTPHAAPSGAIVLPGRTWVFTANWG